MQLSVNGVDTFVATGGKPFEPSLPAVVLLHGAGFDHSTWALHSRWFAHHGYSVLAPDSPAMAARREGRCRPSPTWRTGPRPCWMPQARDRQDSSATPWAL
jgi:pimeloyl-ACP methyl ester carboxylesterase